jgi:GNAT superfamily N-acetyltransferase
MHQNGYHKLPPGKLANAVTWLEIDAPAPQGVAALPGLTLRRLKPADAALFHTLFREIGRDWLWSGLINKPEAEIAARLARTDIISFAALDGETPVGMLDLELTGEGAEVVYFGFVPSFIGRGAGAWLMDEAKRICREQGVGRLWLHTCNFDHPKAVAFYQRQGFRITAVGYEIMDDPRALGLLPKDAAPQVPFVEG